MAEGGDADDANPFTFKSFVTKKTSTTKKTTLDDDVDIFNFTDDKVNRKRDKPKKQILVVEEDPPVDQPKKKEKSENPFSFKKFLSGPSKKTSDTKPPHSLSKKVNDNSLFNDNSDIGTELSRNKIGVAASDLPDFVQDHYSDGSVGRGTASGTSHSLSQSPHLDLPDFTAEATSQDFTVERNRSVSQGSNKSQQKFGLPEQADDALLSADGGSLGYVNIENDKDNDHVGQSLTNLPDFLSDTTASSGISTNRKHNKTAALSNSRTEASHSVGDGVDQEVLQLREDNTRLAKQVERLKMGKKESENRVSELEQMLVAQKKKEVEETSAMEHAMEQVEHNLSITTKRAVQAETTVTKLKQEVKTLQAEVKRLRGEAQLSGDKGLQEIKERTNYVASQLSTATSTAETSLKQLLTGVEQLKVLSQVLESVDKISEDTSPTDS